MRAILAIAPAILLAGPASATTYLVRPDGTGDFPTIQDAIDSATDGDVIELADGVFRGFRNRFISYEGKALTVRSQSGDPASCIVDAENRELAFRFVTAEPAEASLERISVTNADGRGTGNGVGGAVRIRGASPRILDCWFYGNVASTGAGVGIDGGPDHNAPTAPVIERCRIWNNDAATGGGLSCRDPATTVEVRDCSFVANASGWQGGAVVTNGGPSLLLENCLFEGNEANIDGGAVFENGNVELTVRSCTFRENRALRHGGAMQILCWSAGTRLVEHCTFLGNVAVEFGGALDISASGEHLVTVRDCLIVGNVSQFAGGAIYFGGDYEDVRSAYAEIRSTTIVANRAVAFGGGVYSIARGNDTHQVTFDQTLLYGNCAKDGNDVFISGHGGFRFSCSAIDTSQHVLAGSGPLEYGADNVFGDPLLCDPADCGTAPTTEGVYSLMAGSPALPANNACGMLMGVFGVGCQTSGVEPASWGSLKARYRSP
jgi:hypothetical protein